MATGPEWFLKDFEPPGKNLGNLTKEVEVVFNILSIYQSRQQSYRSVSCLASWAFTAESQCPQRATDLFLATVSFTVQMFQRQDAGGFATFMLSICAFWEKMVAL